MQGMDGAADKLDQHKENYNLDCVTAPNISNNPTNTIRLRGRVERHEIAAKSG
jgi:hypothetical protein